MHCDAEIIKRTLGAYVSLPKGEMRVLAKACEDRLRSLLAKRYAYHPILERNPCRKRRRALRIWPCESRFQLYGVLEQLEAIEMGLTDG